MRKIYAEGHRGACALYPENTLLSYRKVMEMSVEIKAYTEETVDITANDPAALLRLIKK